MPYLSFDDVFEEEPGEQEREQLAGNSADEYDGHRN